MKTITMRKKVGMGGKGAWVGDDCCNSFVRPARLVHRANSGNETWEWELAPGHTYTYQENWYGKKTRKTITV